MHKLIIFLRFAPLRTKLWASKRERMPYFPSIMDQVNTKVDLATQSKCSTKSFTLLTNSPLKSNKKHAKGEFGYKSLIQQTFLTNLVGM